MTNDPDDTGIELALAITALVLTIVTTCAAILGAVALLMFLTK